MKRKRPEATLATLPQPWLRWLTGFLSHADQARLRVCSLSLRGKIPAPRLCAKDFKESLVVFDAEINEALQALQGTPCLSFQVLESKIVEQRSLQLKQAVKDEEMYKRGYTRWGDGDFYYY